MMHIYCGSYYMSTKTSVTDLNMMVSVHLPVPGSIPRSIGSD